MKRTSSTTAVGQLNFGANLNLYNITRNESVSDSFNDARDKDLYHFTWVPLNKLIRFTEALKNRYIELLGEVITKDQRVYLDSCIDALVLISDYMVRECALNGDYDYNEPGCESPHVRNPTSGKFRDHCPQFVYACSKFIPGAWKHREAADRTQYYGNGGNYRDHVYVYIIPAETAKLVKFLGLGFNYSASDKFYGKTPFPVKVNSCYKIHSMEMVLKTRHSRENCKLTVYKI